MKNIVLCGTCPECEHDPVSCKYNYFENDDLTIDAWEHRCHNCGWRTTTAYRSDDEDLDTTIANPKVCPYCQRASAT
jgi:hypothetical protein